MNPSNTTLQQLKQQAHALISQHKLQQAITLYQRIVELDSNNAEHKTQLGTLYAMDGNFEKALALYEQAIALAPNMAVAYYSLANVQKKVDQIDAAINNLKKAVELKPDWRQAIHNLANTLMHVGRFQEATQVCQTLQTLEPNNIEVMLLHGNALTADRQYGEAIELYWRILALVPDNANALAVLGQLLYDTHRYDELLKYCEHTEKTFPGHPKPLAIRAKVLARQGDWQAAHRILDDVLAKHAPFYEAVTAYAQIARAADAAPKAIALIDTLLKQQGQHLSANNVAELHFSLGKLHDQQKEYGKAFAHFEKGNRLKKTDNDIAAHQRFVEDIIDTLNKPYFENAKKLTESSSRPVFIIGMPRSGTSLIEQVLDSHSQVFGAGELQGIALIAQQISGSSNAPLAYANAVTNLSREELQHYSKQYLDNIATLDHSARYVTDKMPQNFLHLGLISRLFPDAHIIHCLRNPVDTCLSCYFQSFSKGHTYAYDLDTLASYYRSYHKLMQHWKEVLDLPFFTLEYEALIDQPQPTITKLLRFLDLPWEERCMKHHENPRLTVTASHDQVRQPIYSRSVQRQQNYAAHIDPLKDLP